MTQILIHWYAYKEPYYELQKNFNFCSVIFEAQKYCYCCKDANFITTLWDNLMVKFHVAESNENIF